MGARGVGRGRRLGLTRDRVVAAATELIDRDGLDSFSLRRLAAELDVETMSLYNHVPNRDALLDGVAEALLAGIDFSGADTGSWQDRIRAHAAAFRAAALRHPGSFPLVLTRPPRSSAALGAIRSALAAAADLRLPPRELVHVLRAYVAFVAGSILRELGSAITPGTMGRERELHRIGEIEAAGDPLLTSVAAHLATSDHDVEFAYGIELLIAGLAARAGVPYDGGPPRSGHGGGGPPPEA
ncbi:TetR/AcrR family transcriptional regulator C-terminal domain-containing protein [Nocardiopsis sp. NPDC050513]|uniref:TetR/AcrR family transcriptional regulator C-terminal domain-containing protein n=1 Tax=Nocardiopsis sp. NPDC050513 TaxID=3364338 RepID=UPI0037B16B02